MNLTDSLDAAKQRLRIPELWRMLGLPGEAAKTCRSPFREDSNPSFSVFDEGLKFKDHGTGDHGDAPDFLARARNLPLAEAIREFKQLAGVEDTAPAAPSRSNPSPQIIATYNYTDESGALLFQVVRFEPKTFRQRRPDPSAADGWAWKLDGVRRVPYRLPEVLAAISAGQSIFLTEGEKDALALVANGFPATCNPGGAGKWLDDYSATLAGADVVIVADKDEPGRNHARLVATKLHGHARSVRTVELPDHNGQPVKDAHDFFAAGATADDFRKSLSNAIPFTPLVPDLPTATAPRVSKPVIVLPPDDDSGDAPPKPFPLDALPPAMALLAAGVARTARVPDRLTGPCVLGLVSAAIGAGLEVQSDTQRTTRGNLFLLVSAETGTGKSRTFEIIAAPLLDYQERLQEHWRKEAGPRLLSELKILEREIANFEKKAAKTPDKDERERLCDELKFKIAKRDELARRSVQPVLFAQDVTTERLTAMVEEQGEVLFSGSSDCRKVVSNLMGAYTKEKGQTDESFYLAGYSGDHIRVDRGSRPPVNLRRPCLGLLWFGQPDLVESMLAEDSLSVSGFLPRCLICHSHAAPQRIEGEPEATSESVLARWSALATDLLATYRQPGVRHVLQPTPEARQRLVDYHNAIVERRSTELRDVTGFAARWAEQAWRLTVVLHAGLHGAEAHNNHPLDSTTAECAIRLAEWFAASQLDILSKGRHEAAKKIEEQVLELIQDRTEHQKLDYLTARDVRRDRIVATPEAAAALLARMEADGLLVGEDVRPEGGGRSTRVFRAAGGNNPVPG